MGVPQVPCVRLLVKRHGYRLVDPLGQRVGQVARWTTPSGEVRAAEIVAIEFQPEANGDYTT